MNNVKISELEPVTDFQNADQFPIARGNSTRRISGQIIRTTINTANKYTQNVGDGINNSYIISHNLGSRDVFVQVYNNDNFVVEIPTITLETINTLRLQFTSPPGINKYRVVILK
jgi:hypothetical protein